MDYNNKTPDQLADMFNSYQEPTHLRVDYYKKLLIPCYTDTGFQNMVNNINFNGVTHLYDDDNNDVYLLNVKSSNNNVVVGAINNNINLSLSDLYELAIPMAHKHLNKKEYVQDHFFYKITNKEENDWTKKFIDRIRLIDDKIKQMISDYIRNIDPNSPIAVLLKKNGVTYNKNWTYSGIIKKFNNNEFIFMHYFRKSNNGDTKIGTRVYRYDKFSKELDELLSLNTNCFINGKIYPIIKVNSVVVSKKKGEKSPVTFTCKAYFVDINMFHAHCDTKNLNND